MPRHRGPGPGAGGPDLRAGARGRGARGRGGHGGAGGGDGGGRGSHQGGGSDPGDGLARRRAPTLRGDRPVSERLQKFLARAGVASRRHAEGLITAGRVSVNNQRVTELGTKVEPTDLVTVDGTLVTAPETTSWYLLHKPPGVVTTLSDPRAGPPWPACSRGSEQRVFPVGRLDCDAEGALLLTNDGAAGAPAAAPELRGAADVPGQGEGHAHRRDARPGCARAFASRTARRARCGPSASRSPRRTPGSCSRSARGSRTSSSASARRWATRWSGCSARPRRASRSPGSSRASCGR